jgi:hypothetical protein
MMIMLRDDPVIEVFDSPENPPSWIEAIDVENEEYKFCDDQGQRYVGRITPASTWRRQPEFVLRPEGVPELKNVLDLIERANVIEPTERFPDLDSLRKYLTIRIQ